MHEEFLNKKLKERKEQNALRSLRLVDGKIDFCSNDYLGIVRNRLITPIDDHELVHGSTGSRLLSGNYPFIEHVEKKLAAFHSAESALIFNSGYDANVGLLGCIAQKDDLILYDFLSHASIRDGIRLSFAHSYSFRHNDLEDLENKLQLEATRPASISRRPASSNIFVVTESVFSMDGHVAPLSEMSELCRRYKAHLIVDEAHATGVIGERGEGLVQKLGIQSECFARVHTFGKAVGCHGAVIFGSSSLREYLINFSRPLMYSTSLPPVSIAAVDQAYTIFPKMKDERNHLQNIIDQFQSSSISFQKLESSTAIQGVVIPGNDEVKLVAKKLQENGFDIRPILYPSVPVGSERLRIVLHSYNTEEELSRLVKLLQ